MDSLITAAARALAVGDALGALNRIALRKDAAALALRIRNLGVGEWSVWARGDERTSAEQVADDRRGTVLDIGSLATDAEKAAVAATVLGGLWRRRAERKPTLIVIDEAGNTPLRSLPEYASTLAGLGVLLVTIWQSIAQLEAAYGRAADTILTNHLSKVFYSGLSDPATLRYLGTVLGEAEVETRSRTASGGPGPTASQWATTRNPLAPVHAVPAHAERG